MKKSHNVLRASLAVCLLVSPVLAQQGRERASLDSLRAINLAVAAFFRTAPVAVSFSTAVAINAPTVIQLQGSDADGTPLTYATTSSPSHGALSQLNTSTGVVVYTPTAGYTGSDSFQYTVTSGGATTSAATVTITVTAAKTRVIDTFTNPDGTPRQGRVSFFLTQVASSPSGIIPAKASVSCQLTGTGQCDVSLYPSRAVSPVQFYQAWYYDNSGGSQFLGLYDMPAATGTITLAGHKVTDANLGAQYVFASRAEIEALMLVVQTATAAVNSLAPPADIQPLARDLQAFWNLDELGGSRLDSANYHYLFPQGAISTVSGKLGNATHFNGGFLAHPDSDSLSGGTGRALTLSAWVKAGTLTTTEIIAHKVASDGTDLEYGLYFDATSHKMKFSVSSNGSAWTGTVEATSFGAGTTNWDFYVAWYDPDAGTLNIRVNNGPVDSVSYSGGVRDGGASLYIGSLAGTAPFHGDLDGFGLWKRALTSTEQSTLYASGAGRQAPFSPRQLGMLVPGYFDPNAAPFSCVPNSSDDQTPCVRALMNAITAYAQASGNSPAVLAEFTPGKYKLSSAPEVVGPCRAQVCLPQIGEVAERPVVAIGSKLHTISNTPYGAAGSSGSNKGNVVLESTLTGLSVNSDGKPFIFGGPDALETGSPTRIALHWRGITVRTPANPSIGGLNCELCDRAVIEDSRFDTADPNLGWYGTPNQTEPTHPTGISILMPVNNYSGAEYRGTVEVTGWYAGPAISELTSSSGWLQSIQNKVCYNLQTPWYQFGEVKGYAVRCPYGIAQVDPSSGVVAPTGIATTDRSFLMATISFEDAATGWQVPVAHVYDPNNKLKGRLTFLHVLSGVGNTSTGLTLSGGTNLTLVNLGL
jgi:hypothetical protein